MKKGLSKISLLFIDIILINLAYLLAIYIRFGGVIGIQFLSDLPRYLNNAIFITIIKLGIFNYFKMYKTVWRYASMVEIYNIITAIILSNASVLSFLFIRQANLSRSIYILTTLIDLAIIGGLRFYLRDFDRNIDVNNKDNSKMKKSMIIGADAGVMLIREYKNDEQTDSCPVVIIDDDIKRQGVIIDEIPVVGGRQSILSVVDNYHIDEIIIALPSASRKEISEIIDICKETKCKLKILPVKDKLIDEDMTISNIRDVEIEDLLGREEVEIDLDEFSSYITNKVVMVSSGGDSIGSQLCRQIAAFNPKELIILDIWGKDRDNIDDIFESGKPEVIFHAIGYRYITLIEEDPKEIIMNNVFATLNLVQAADIYNVKKFLMISTDKVANPTNIMEASKRICEMIIQSMNAHSNTEYVTIRFDNVIRKPIFIDYRLLLKSLGELKRLIMEGKEDGLINYIRHLVPNYEDSNEINKSSEDKKTPLGSA